MTSAGYSVLSAAVRRAGTSAGVADAAGSKAQPRSLGPASYRLDQRQSAVTSTRHQLLPALPPSEVK